MSSSTALLPKDRRQGDEHPIFLRVCHSPWMKLGQKALCGLRGLTTAYLIAVFCMIIDYDINHVEHGYLAFFEFINISYFMLVLYHIIAFTWTFMHLHHPHLERHEQSFVTSFYKFMSPPRPNPSSKNRTWFSIYYMAINTFPWVSAVIYWAVLIPLNKSPISPNNLPMTPLPETPRFQFNSTLPVNVPDTIPLGEMFSYGWFPPFIVFNRYLIAPFITLLEVFFFSSIKRSTPIVAHLFGLTFLVASYIGWVFVGFITLDRYSFYFFDPKAVGWEHVVSSWAAFVATEIFFFWIIYAVIALREGITKKAERKSGAGYQQLPQ